MAMQKILAPFFFMISILVVRPVHAQVSYEISPESTIQISGTSTLSDWVVKSGKVSGEMIFIASPKKSNEEGMQPGTIKDAKAVLEVSSIKSEKGEAMDNKMYDALKNDAHPQIIFSLTQPIALTKAPGKLSVTGNIQLAGVTRPMTFDLNLGYANNAFHFAGTKSLKLSDFEIEPPTAMFGQIETGDAIVVEMNLFFTK